MNFTLPRLFRNPAISNFFSFPLGLRNSGVRLYLTRVITSQKLSQRVALMLQCITKLFARLLAHPGDLTEGPF